MKHFTCKLLAALLCLLAPATGMADDDLVAFDAQDFTYNGTTYTGGIEFRGQITDGTNKTATISLVIFSKDVTDKVFEDMGTTRENFNISQSGNLGVLDVVFPSTVTYENVTYTVTAIEPAVKSKSRTNQVSIFLDRGSSTFDTELTQKMGTGFYYVKSVDIPNSVESLGDYAFYYCLNLQSVYLKEGLESIGKYCFSVSSGNSLNIKNITIPASVTSLGDYCFQRQQSLTNVTFAEESQLTSIGKQAFQYCSGLTSIVLPKNLTTIGSSAFSSCNNLKTVVLLGSNVNDESLGYLSKNAKNATIYSTADYSRLTNGSKVTTLPSIPTFTTADGGTATGYLAPSGKATDDSGNTTYTFDITDGAWTSFSNANDFSTTSTDGTTTAIPVTLNYTRTFKAVGWYAWYMPFTFTMTADLLGKVKIAYPVGIINESEDDASTWQIGVVALKEGESVNANACYFVKPLSADGTNATELGITNATLKATSETKFTIQNSNYNFTFGGNYSDRNFTSGWWGLSSKGDGFIHPSGRLKPFRFYLSMEERTDNPYANQSGSTSTNQARFSIVEFDDEATAIQAINKAVSKDNGAVYDLQGRRVTKPVRGIYIQNGRKVLVK